MLKLIAEARKLFLMIKKQIKDIQYAYDDPKEYSVNINNNYYLEDYQIKAKKLELNSRGLKISEELFPGLYKSIKNVVEVNITNEISFSNARYCFKCVLPPSYK